MPPNANDSPPVDLKSQIVSAIPTDLSFACHQSPVADGRLPCSGLECQKHPSATPRHVAPKRPLKSVVCADAGATAELPPRDGCRTRATADVAYCQINMTVPRAGTWNLLGSK